MHCYSYKDSVSNKVRGRDRLRATGLRFVVGCRGSTAIQLHRVAKKLAPFLYALTLPNINRFSKLFHCQTQEKICSNTMSD